MNKTLRRDFVCGKPPADTGNTMEEKRGISADWSQLPLDLIEKIAGTLDEDIADRVRFGAVCKSWLSAVKPTANLPRVRLPWLCLMDDKRRDQTNFFSLGRNKHYDILHTHLQIEALSSHGWILTVDSGKTAWLLLNPITKVQILLPLPPSDPDEIYRYDVIVTPDSLVVVMVGFSHGPILCYRRPLDPKGVENTGDAWTEIFCCMVDDVEGPTYEDVSNVFSYHQGRCFIFEAKHSVTSIVDPDTRQVVSVIPPMTGTDIMYPAKDSDAHYIRLRYLVRSSSGEELFLVISPSRTEKEIFEVFVLDRSDQQQAKWSNEALLPLLQLSGSGARIVNVSSLRSELKRIPGEEIRHELGDIENLDEEKIDMLLRRFLDDLEGGRLVEGGWTTMLPAYSISKQVLNAYTRVLARRHPAMCINCVHPGYVKTDINWNTGVITSEEGAKGPAMLALLPDGGPSGCYFDQTMMAEF